MQNCMDTLDWSLIRSLLAVTDHGSLSAAARATGFSQPTLGRHIREAEAQLGVTLFERQARGLRLTEAGQALMPAARAMRAAAADLTLAAAGRDAGLRGTVRLTASEMVSHHLLPPIIADLRRQEPDIAIDLVPTDLSENLLFREADIALRMYRPQQLDLVVRRLRDLPVGFYAAPAYLDRTGRPQTLDELLARDFVGFDRSEVMIRALRAAGRNVSRDDFPVRCDHQPTHWQLVRAGCGIGAAQTGIGDADPAVERLLPGQPVPVPPLELWLAAPEALRATPRIRRVWDHLVAAFAAG